MKIGINYNMYSESFSCYGNEKFKKLKELEFDSVDFALANTKTPLYTLPQKEAEKILILERTLAENSGILISQTHGPWCWPPPETEPGGKEKRMDEMRRCVLSTSVLGCKHMVVHPIMPYFVEEINTEKAEKTWEENLIFMGELVSYAKNFGVTICIENMPMHNFSLSTPEMILKLVKEINDDNFKICLDTGHIAVYDKLNLDEEVKRLGKEIRVLHVHDNTGNIDIHLLPFRGKLCWQNFAKTLAEIGYEGTFSMELPTPAALPLKLREDLLKLYAETAKYILSLREL